MVRGSQVWLEGWAKGAWADMHLSCLPISWGSWRDVLERLMGAQKEVKKVTNMVPLPLQLENYRLIGKCTQEKAETHARALRLPSTAG